MATTPLAIPIGNIIGNTDAVVTTMWGAGTVPEATNKFKTDLLADINGANVWGNAWNKGIAQVTDANGGIAWGKNDFVNIAANSGPTGANLIKEWLTAANELGSQNPQLTQALSMADTTVHGNIVSEITMNNGAVVTQHGATTISSAVPIYRDTSGNISSSAKTVTTTSYNYTVDVRLGVQSRTETSQTNIPKMRAFVTMLHATGLKPFTKMYTRLNGVDANGWSSQAFEFIIGNVVGTFLGVDDMPLATDEPNARVNGDGHTLFQFGELINYRMQNGTTGTIVCVRHYTRLTKGNTAETVIVGVCQKGSDIKTVGSSVGTTLYGRNSKATATITGYYLPEGWDSFSNGSWEGGATGTTDAYGNLSTRLYVHPETIATGTVDVTIVDNPLGDWSAAKSKAKATMWANGTQHNYLNVVQMRQETRTATNTTITDNTLTGYDVNFKLIDPLAQSFSLPDKFPNGAMVTSVDLYFYMKNDTLPVSVAIVGMTNGYPNQEVYAECTLMSDKLNASGSSLVPTTFKFPKLVYLEANKEYAIRVMSNSNKYRLWTSKMGEIDITTRAMITQQPSTGTLFKSQNSSTWSADQLSDMCFQLNVAEFDISQTGQVRALPMPRAIGLPANPFKCTANSTRVRVTHPNHSLMVGDYVTYKNSTDTAFNNSFVVESVLNSDTYTLVLSAARTLTEMVGGKSVGVDDYQVRIDMGRLYCNNFAPAGTSIKASIKTSDATRTKAYNFTEIGINQYFGFSSPQYMMSLENESKWMNSVHSMVVELALTSNDKNFSPVIDLEHLGLITCTNRAYDVDTTAIGTQLFAEDLATVVNGSANVSFSNTAATISSTSDDFTNFNIGAYVVVTGSVAQVTNNKTYKILNIDYTNRILYVDAVPVTQAAGDPITVKQYPYLIDGIAPRGDTAESVYVTTPIRLKNKSTGLKILMDSQIPDNTLLTVYYRTAEGANVANGINDQLWNTIASVASNNNTGMVEREYNTPALDAFDIFEVKIVMSSTNMAVVPQAKNLRIIAVA